MTHLATAGRPTGPEGGARPRVGLVAYFFPPLGGVAVARTLGFVRYLPEAGWEPVVIAPERSPYVLVDPAGTAAIPPGTEVLRGLSPEPTHLSGLLRRARGLLRAGGEPASASAATAPPSAPVDVPRTPSAVRSAPAPGPMSSAVRSTAAGPRRLAGQLRTLVWFPDDQVGWLPFAVLAIVRAHRRSPLAAVVSSSSPVTAHLAAGIARRLLGIAWIADFRDPWLDNPIEPRPGRLTQWRRRVVETWIVRSADRCTFATPSLAETYRRRYPRAAGRMDLVPNGYDRAELGTPAASRSRRKRRSAGPVRLVYAGSLYRPAELETFLLGVRRLMGRRDVSDRLRVDFVGTVTDASRAIADRQLVEEPGLEAIVAFHGFVPREEALRRIAEADAALTLLGAGPGMEMFVGAKLFDYIGLDRPILAVVPPGDAGRVLADLGWGIAADPTPEGVADGLSRLIDDPAAAAGRTGRADPEGRYDRRRTAALLGELLRCSVEGADPAWGSRSNAASDRP